MYAIRSYYEALGEVSARHGNVETQLNRRQTLGQRRSAAGAATEQIDEGVFEARWHLRQPSYNFV